MQNIQPGKNDIIDFFRLMTEQKSLTVRIWEKRFVSMINNTTE
jgi:hypothetical protein